MRILHLPTSVGGHSWKLAQGEKQQNLESFVLVSTDTWLQYPCDMNLRLNEVRSKSLKLAKLVKCFFDIRNRYDVFHFNFGSSLIHLPHSHLNQFEVPFYPKHARLFVTYNGCDIRQKYPTVQSREVAACHNQNCAGGLCNSGQEDEIRRQGLQKLEPFVSHIWALNPDLLRFLPAEKASFLPYAIAVPSDRTPTFSLPEKKLKIVHAPTNREAKGSFFILEALERLQSTHGQYFDFQIVENIPNEAALKIYAEADLVIDQILIGWYGAFAMECMLMGKPVIARIAEEDLHHLPVRMAKDVKEAVINAEPSTIYDVIKHCIEDRQFLRQKAIAGYEYVLKWHDTKYVAALTKAQYEKAFDMAS